MARSALALFAILCYFSAVCKGGVHQVVYNEDDLSGSCKSTCKTLRDFSDKLGCDRISNCRFNRKGWTRGFVRCDWCTCDCRTSHDVPQKEVIHESKKILNEDELWGTCRRTCSAWGLQKSNAFGCSEIRDCKLHQKGWVRWFVRCNYCECKCVIKGYPHNYRLENLKFNIDLVINDEADSVVIGKTTVENHSSREQTFTKTISTSFEESRLWEETSSSTTLTSRVIVSILEPILDIARIESTTTHSKSSEYKWGETKIQSIKHTTKQEVVVGPHSRMEVSMVGSNYISSVPYTADLVITYDNGRKTRKSVSGILHEATVFDVRKNTPLPKKRSYIRESAPLKLGQTYPVLEVLAC